MWKTSLLTVLLAGGMCACASQKSAALADARLDKARAEHDVAAGREWNASARVAERDQLEQAQLKERIALEDKQHDQTAKLMRKQAEERAQEQADGRQLLASEASKVQRASAEVQAERVKAESEARERLGKIDARARELSTESEQPLAQDVRGKVRAGWNEFAVERERAVDAMKELADVAPVKLAGCESEVDKRFARLDATLAKIEKDLK